MNNRVMRVFIMFDLPMLTKKQKKDYRKFRRDLLMNGFVMLQESIYIKLVANQAGADTVIENVKKLKPPEGLIQALTITEKQFGKMVDILGIRNSVYVCETDSVVEL